jgi:hypothetical protein
MPANQDLADVEHFAELSARLADPFAERDAVLRDVWLDPAGWEKEQAQ